MVLRWQSADKRFAIITVPGHSSWMAVGLRGYYASKHCVVDLSKAGGKCGYTLYMACNLREWSGRLSKVQQRDLEQTAERSKL